MIQLATFAMGSLSLAYMLVRYSERDTVTLLTIWLAMLWLMSSRWILAPLGAVGMPALVFGVGLMIVWLGARLSGHRSLLAAGPQPVRIGVACYASIVLLSFAMAQFRPLSELEQTSSVRALIVLASMTGIVLLTADGVRNRARLDKLLQRLVLVATVAGVVGCLQFFIGLDLAPNLRLPGLVQHGSIMGVRDRSIFGQAYGTTQHPIEFGVVMATVVPLAVHYAAYAKERRTKALWWAAVMVLAVGCLVSVARSGVVAIGVAIPVLALAWGWRWRLSGAVYGLSFLSVMWAVVPGLVGTIRSLFQGMGNDPSVRGRRERVPLVIEQLRENGPLGLGPGTHTPEEYFLLDNAYYGTLMDLGWPGVFTLLLMFGTGMAAALIAKRGQDSETKHLAQAILAGLAVLPVVMATFSALSFPTYAGTTFLLLGAAGALWRITLPDRVAAARCAGRPVAAGHAPNPAGT